jgi:ubiquitin carboxyl-terminal hydrolase 25/28
MLPQFATAGMYIFLHYSVLLLFLTSESQYFYTIKELRDAVAPMANLDEKSLEDEKVTDDALKQHRVGGRLVTRREVGRSKKCKGNLYSLSSFI